MKNNWFYSFILCLAWCIIAPITAHAYEVRPIRVACSPAAYPFQFLDEDGTPKGFDIDLVGAIMKKMGMPYEVVIMEPQQALEELKKRHIDVMITAQDDSLANEVCMGTAFDMSTCSYVVRKNCTVECEKQLKDHQIGVVALSSSHIYAKKYLPGCKVYPNNMEAFNALKLKDCDALLCELRTAQHVIDDLQLELRILDTSVPMCSYNFATYKGNQTLMNQMSTALLSLRINHEFDEIYDKWFGRSIFYVFLQIAIFCFILVISSAVSVWFYQRKANKARQALKKKITDLQQMTHSLREAYNKFPYPLFIVDPDKNFKIITENETSFRDYDMRRLINHLEKNYPEVNAKGIVADQQCLDENRCIYKDFEITLPSGNLMNVQATHCPITLFNHKLVLVSIFNTTPLLRIQRELMHKNTELQKAKETAENNVKLRSIFLANMSHEIRTPLNAIVGFSQVITYDDTTPEEKQRFSQLIEHNCDVLLQLINDILDLSKIEAGIETINNEPFDFGAYFNLLAENFTHSTHNSELEIICQNPSPSLWLNLDKRHITQVINNYMTNAIKFTKKGHVCMRYTYQNQMLHIEVEDTGIGISSEKINCVFERYKKLNEFSQGFGLGLNITKSVVEACGGQVGVRSELGKGSTFWADIPCKEV